MRLDTIKIDGVVYFLGDKEYVTPEMFGAVGDGVTDDSTAITNALKEGKTVLLSGTYAVGSTISGSTQKIIGNNTKIVLLNDIDTVFTLTGTQHFSGVSFDCNNKGVGSCVYVSNTDSIELADIKIQNVKDMRNNKTSHLIYVFQVPTVNIHDVVIENCLHLGNGTVTDNGGAIYGIFVNHNEKHCTIENVVGKEIHNIDANGNILFEDSGLIYINSQHKDAGTFIRKVTGYNYGKRLIKAQCANEVVIDGIHAYTNSKDHLVAIGIGSRESGSGEIGSAIISNCVLENAYATYTASQFQYLISTSEKVKVSNCTFKTIAYPSIQNTGDMSISNCTIEGIGIQNDGRTLHVDNVQFVGTCFHTSYDKSNLTETTITNCNIKHIAGTGAFNTVKIVLCGESTTLENTVIDCGKIQPTQGKCRIKNVRMVNSTDVDTILPTCESIEIIDTDISTVDGTTVTRAINTTVKTLLKNVTGEGYTYIAVCKGQTEIRGGVDFAKLHTVNATAFSNVPEYVASLPYKGNHANGTKVILLSSNQLHTLVDGSWSLVG